MKNLYWLILAALFVSLCGTAMAISDKNYNEAMNLSKRYLDEHEGTFSPVIACCAVLLDILDAIRDHNRLSEEHNQIERERLVEERAIRNNTRTIVNRLTSVKGE